MLYRVICGEPLLSGSKDLPVRFCEGTVVTRDKHSLVLADELLVSAWLSEQICSDTRS